MNARSMFRLLAVTGLATAASAQSITSDTMISMPMTWRDTGNNNGIIEPGEAIEITFSVSFTNQFGVASFSPSIGTFTGGTILGLGSGFVDLVGSGGTSGNFQLGNNPAPQTNNGTTGVGVRSGWRLVGNASPGSVNAAGTGVTQIQFGQFPAAPELANTTNPINRMFSMLWTPSSYAVRSITFQLVPAAGAGQTVASVYMDLNGSVGASAFVTPSNLHLGSVTIPVIPAPATLALMGLGALVARRRRR